MLSDLAESEPDALPKKISVLKKDQRGKLDQIKSVLPVAFMAYTTRGILLQLYRAKIISKRRERMKKSVLQLNVQRPF